MAERKQVNRYYPPDFDPAKHKSINKYRNSHPLRERAKKLSQGILVIRFEMPYNIWCDGCGNHIGMGVRYNAEKKKVGKYYTTPIYRFRMKCHLCDNYIEMETDPQNFDYTIVSGARRKNQKWDMAENEQVLTEDREAVKKLARDAMYKLEHGVDDTKKLKAAAPTLSQIAEVQAGKKDDYSQNQLLRKKFRTEKKQLLAVEASDKALLAKSSLDIELVPEAEEDKKLASLLKYSATESYEEKRQQKREEIRGRELFATATISSPSSSEPSLLPSPKSQTNKHQEAQRTLMSKVLKSKSTGVFGAFESPGSSRGSSSSGGLLGKRTQMIIGGTTGIVVNKKRKRVDHSPKEQSDRDRKRSKVIGGIDDRSRTEPCKEGFEKDCSHLPTNPDNGMCMEPTGGTVAEFKSQSSSSVIDLANGRSTADAHRLESGSSAASVDSLRNKSDESVMDSQRTENACMPDTSTSEKSTIDTREQPEQVSCADMKVNENTRHSDMGVNTTNDEQNVDALACHSETNMCSDSQDNKDMTSDSGVSNHKAVCKTLETTPSGNRSEAEDSDVSKLGQSSLSLVSCYSSSSESDSDET
ncbi:uncharacterized protein [Diadema antillarum]|uniref:uncharacterized protein n=1 Tax=Diadema antillarum TaxID=105358 RepID=UPI003A897108